MTPRPHKELVGALGAGTWRKGDRIDSEEQAQALNLLIGMRDEIDSVIECYVTGGLDESEFLVELERACGL